ncbi:radical SAM protein [Streptomyces sp. NPDC004610]|uniref:radical SAM protein n=1 Tax=unclassified Streptomyces TaxID=2593676 RepID=UPI0033AC31BF
MTAPFLEAPADGDAPVAPRFLWLDLTRNCQLECTHCYNASGPSGSHGDMSRENWLSVLDQAAGYGIRLVQMIGGEPTMHPHFAELVGHALDVGLKVEVYSNLVHVAADCWRLLQREGVSLATSYYGPPAQHNSVTKRPSHARTLTNIKRAVAKHIPLRASVVVLDPSETGAEATAELHALGVTDVRVDHTRPFGRAAEGRKPHIGGLCGRCGDGRASIGPDGQVSPCVFSTWIGVGNARRTPLAAILGGPEMADAQAAIRQGRGLTRSMSCGPDSPCGPDDQRPPCGPETDDECTPGYPGTECNPRN